MTTKQRPEESERMTGRWETSTAGRGTVRTKPVRWDLLVCWRDSKEASVEAERSDKRLGPHQLNLLCCLPKVEHGTRLKFLHHE